MDRRLSPDDLEDIEQAFRAAGLRPTVYRTPARRGLEELNWLVIAAVPLSSFLTTMGTKLAEDSYKELRQLAHRVFGRAPASKASTLVLEDQDTGTQVVLEPDLSDKGYQALFETDFARYSGDTVRYDPTHERWIRSNG
ncbi:hypothetical protein ACU610_17615 [Geodermatophilus sp. URMC 61]|uniref:hypothetical protein n=1 Tax=Geodermatophilus sp. URMC 61 TaxID=3423411 RepID=UPI00406CA5A9